MAEPENVDILNNSSWASEVEETENQQNVWDDISKLKEELQQLTIFVHGIKSNPFNVPPPPPPQIQQFPQVVTCCGQQNPPQQQQQERQPPQHQSPPPPQHQPPPQYHHRSSNSVPYKHPPRSSNISEISYFVSKDGEYIAVFNGQKGKHGKVVGVKRKTINILQAKHQVKIDVPVIDDPASDIRIFGIKIEKVVNCVNEISSILLTGF